MRWIFRLIGLVVVIVLILVGGLFLVPTERIAAIATQQFSQMTGRELRIDGSVRPTLWPNLGARIEGVRIANPDWAEGDAMVTAEAVDVGVDLAALWGGAVRVRGFELSGARVTLERGADGRVNWDFGMGGQAADAAAAPDAGASGGLPAVGIDRAEIRDMTLRYIDRAAGTDIRVEGVTLVLAMPEAGGAADLTLSADTAAGAVTAAMQVGSVENLIAGRVTPLAAHVTGEGTDFRFDGRLGLTPLAAEGRVEGRIARLAPLLALAGQSGAEPLPEAARPLALAGQVDGSEQ